MLLTGEILIFFLIKPKIISIMRYRPNSVHSVKFALEYLSFVMLGARGDSTRNSALRFILCQAATALKQAVCLSMIYQYVSQCREYSHRAFRKRMVFESGGGFDDVM